MASEEAEKRRARADKLQEAIQEYMEGQGFRPDGTLGEWMVIGCNVYIDQDGDPNAEYFYILGGGSMLQHHALGLLDKANKMLDEQASEEDNL